MTWTEAFNGIFFVFGCVAYAHVPTKFHHKLDDTVVKCIFVGYRAKSIGNRLYNPTTRKIFVSREMIFSENSAHVHDEFNMPSTPNSLDVFKGLLLISLGSEADIHAESQNLQSAPHVTDASNPKAVEDAVL